MPKGVVEDALTGMTMARIRCLILIWDDSHNYCYLQQITRYHRLSWMGRVIWRRGVVWDSQRQYILWEN